jgi:sarcosine oxidase subunit beta
VSSIVAAMHGLRPDPTHPLQAFVIEPQARVDGLVSSMDLYVYISQTARGELLVGAEILPYNTYSQRSTFDFLAEASKRSIMILPVMARARAMRQWAGLCDMTPDSSPILGPT